MSTYAGYGGSVRLTFYRADLTTLFSGLAALTQWTLRVQYDMQFMLVESGAETFHAFGRLADSSRFTGIRSPFRQGGMAELSVVGLWDTADDPFRLPEIWTPARQDYPPVSFEVRPTEGLDIPRIQGSGNPAALEFSAAVRGLVSFQARIACTLVEYVTAT